MEVTIKPNYDTNRTCLRDVIPLPSPYTIVLETTRLCNFKCYYCMQSTRDNVGGAYRQADRHQNFMEMGLYRKLAQEIVSMNPQPKRILFQGLGESLLDKDLVERIQILRNLGFVGRIDLTTNASLMTKEWADALVKAGTSRINVSLQGLDAETYRDVCGVELDFDTFLSQLQYLFDHRGETHVYIKIIDSMLKRPQDEKRFYDIFGNLCDTIYIEHLVVNQIQMGDIEGRVLEKQKNIFQMPVLPRQVCPVVFYQMQVFADGAVLACPVSAAPPEELQIGDARTESLEEIWNGQTRKNFLKKMLTKKRAFFEACKVCQMVYCIADEKESLDDYAEQLLERMDLSNAIRN